MLAYLRLLRLPNVFTAMADVSMGFLFAHGALAPVGPYLSLLAASSLLYLAGMVLNDLFDLEVDRQERPQRPLPSGAVPLGTARALGWGMLAAGTLAGIAAGWIAPLEESLPWRSGAVAVLLALCIVLYDAALKATLAGPVFMGLCRFFNVLLGMSVAEIQIDRPTTLHYHDAALAVAGGIGVYIVGVTILSRSEATRSHRGKLAFGLSVMLAGLALVAMFPQFDGYLDRLRFVGQRRELVWWALLMLLAAPVVRRVMAAITEPSPERVQEAVKHSILSLIFFDAAIVFALCGPLWAALVLALLVPALALARRVYST